MKKALIFSCAMGGGHKAAALALEEHLALEALHVDLYELLLPSYSQSLQEKYGQLHQKKNHRFRFYQKLNQKKTEIRALLHGLEPLYLPQLDELIQREKPDLLVSTYSLSSLCLAAYKRKVDPTFPLVTAITDLSPHLFWVHEETDFYLVAANSTKEELLGWGVPERKILLSGIPTSLRFKPRPKEDLVLVCGGSLGLLPETPAFYHSLTQQFSHVKVFCGKNTSLFEKLKSLSLPLDVCTYKQDLSDDYAKAKLLMTKPGGMTTFEALHSRTPMLLFPAYLEQEKSNEAFVLQNQLGLTMEENFSAQSSFREEDLLFYQHNMETFHKSLDPLSYEKILWSIS